MRSAIIRFLPLPLALVALAAGPAHAMRCAALPAEQLVAQADFLGVVELVEAKSSNPTARVKGGREADGKIHYKAVVRERLKGDVRPGKLIGFSTASHYNAPAGAAYSYRVEDKVLVLLTKGRDGKLEATRCLNWTLTPEQGEEADHQIAAIRALTASDATKPAD